MRQTHLLAAGAAVMAITSGASAQTKTTPSPDPSPRVYIAGDRFDVAPRAALGINTSSTGTLRDTLGLLVSSVMRGGPAEKAGLEEGNRIASINGVNLRSTKADLEDYENAGTLNRRLVRELEKVKPGEEVELRVYRGGRTEALKVRTISSDSLFSGRTVRRFSRSDFEDRPALGIGLGSTGSRRDTLGVLVMSVVDSGPAARAGLEEGNRIAAINGVNLRVAPRGCGRSGRGQREGAAAAARGLAAQGRRQRHASRLRQRTVARRDAEGRSRGRSATVATHDVLRRHADASHARDTVDACDAADATYRIEAPRRADPARRSARIFRSSSTVFASSSIRCVPRSSASRATCRG